MGKLGIFNFTTLNGYFQGPNGNLSWNAHDAEQADFSKDRMAADATLLFGRVTYQMMASYWPTPMALENDAASARGMNAAEKVVFSRSLLRSGERKLDWDNSRLAEGDLEQEVKRLKQGKKDLCVLGSGSLVTQLARANLIDEYAFMINPVALGAGTSTFKGLEQNLELTLVDSKVFANGVVLLTYRPKKSA